jgi:plastocyanin
MSHGKALYRGILGGLIIVAIALPARAQDDSASPTRAEFAKLQNEVREQRKLIIQMLQTEQQRYDMLLHLLQPQTSGETPLPAGVAMGAAGAQEGGPPDSAAKPARSGESARERERERERRQGTVEGKVSVPSGGDVGDVYVYVDGIKAPPVRGRTIEIRQEGRQFSPRSAVVQAGTSVVFPNFDSIYHNVFSSSARNSFDLGAYRAGDKPRSVTLSSPGVVDVFCNMHQKMNARVLVVPNPLYTKVRPDGSFRLENVPVGARRIVAWGVRAKAAQQRVDVTASGTQVSFVLEREELGAHANKLGQVYGSYRD